MERHPDFQDLLASFNAHGVEFIVAGSYALAYHGAPRYTDDIDLLVRISPDNARRIMDSLRDFGFGALGLTEEDFLEEGRVVQLGHPPVRIDLLTSITGVDWARAEAGAVAGEYGGVPVRYLGRAELVINKRACGRHRDLADLEALGESVD